MPNYPKLLAASALSLSLSACITFPPPASATSPTPSSNGSNANPSVEAKVSVMSNENGVLTYQTKDQTFSIQENKDGSFGIILDGKVHQTKPYSDAQKYEQVGSNGEVMAFSLNDLVKHKSGKEFETQYANLIVARKQLADNKYEYIMAPYGTKSSSHSSASAEHNGHVVFNSKLYSKIKLEIDFNNQTVDGFLSSFREIKKGSNIYEQTATTSYAAGNSSETNVLFGSLFINDGKIKDYELSAQLSGTVDGKNYTGSLDGTLYGPNADESAGVVTIEQIGSNNKQIGGFLAK